MRGTTICAAGLRVWPLAVCVMLLLAGCGGGSGGTRGTGGIEFFGKVFDAQNSPLSNLRVELVGTTTRTTTNSNGEFLVTTPQFGEPLFRFTQQSGVERLSVDVPVAGFAQNAPRVEVDFEVDFNRRSGRVRELRERQREGRSDRNDDSDDDSDGSDDTYDDDDSDNEDSDDSEDDDDSDDDRGEDDDVDDDDSDDDNEDDDDD